MEFNRLSGFWAHKELVVSLEVLKFCGHAQGYGFRKCIAKCEHTGYDFGFRFPASAGGGHKHFEECLQPKGARGPFEAPFQPNAIGLRETLSFHRIFR